MRALIVDDRPENLYLLRLLLQAHGHEVEEARHGAEALAKARAAPPQVVISDLLMPVMDGFTLLRQWKADARLRPIPFVVYTATYTDPKDERLALDLGADAFILKPAEPAAFMARIGEVLAAQARGAPAAHAPLVDEQSQLAEYNRALVRKLEERTLQLEHSNRELREDIARRERAEAGLAAMLAQAERSRAALLGILEDERAAKAALQASEERFRHLFESAPLPMTVATGAEGRLLLANDAYCRFFGRERGEMIGRTVAQLGLWAEPAEREAWVARLRAEKRVRGFETRARTAAGEIRDALVTAEEIEFEGKECLLVMVDDITERKRAEDALRKSEQRFRLAASTGDVWDADLVAGTGLVPPQFKRALGYGENEIENTVAALDSLVHPEDLERLRRMRRDHFRDRTPYALEFRARTKAGAYRWFSTRGQAVWDENGRATYMAGTVFDITERKRAEEALRASEKKLRQLIDGTGPAIFIGLLTPEGVLVEANRPALAAAGIEREDVLGKPLEQTYWCSWSEAAQREFRGAIERAAAGEPSRRDVQVRLAGERLAWIDFSLDPMHDESGNVVYLVASAMVIEERKRAEDALRESEARFRAIAAHTPDHILVQDLDLRYEMVVNPQLGLTEAAMLGKTDLDILGPEDGGKLTAAKRSVLSAGRPVSLEVPLSNKKGETEFFEGSYIPRRDAEGRSNGLIGYFRNITERKRAELAAQESSRRLSTLIGNLPGAAYRCRNDAAYTTEFVSDGIAALTGYPAADFLEHRRHIGELIHPQDREQVWSRIQEALGRNRPFEITYRIIDATGAERWVSERGLGVRDAKGELQALEGFLTDITDGRRAQEALRESEARYRDLIERSPDAVLVHSERKIVLANRALCELLGARDASGLIGRPSTFMLDPAFVETASARTERLYAGERLPRSEQVYRRLDGSSVEVEVASVPATFAGRPAVHTTVRDITQRRKADEALREANRRLHALSMRLLEVQEAERTGIARELHDEIGQSLTALKLSTQMLERKARGEVAEKLGACVALAARTLDQVRGLTLDLRPPELEQLGLAVALRELLQRVAAAAGFGSGFSADHDYRALDRRLATAAFRVAQEALTNAARHAGAKNIAVELRTEGAALLLAVADDGRGFDLALARERALKGASMGVLGMEERVSLAGGTLAIATRPGGGTRVEARFPLGP